MMAQQQQQYVQYATQPVGPGATVYAYPGAQQPHTMVIQPGAASTTAVQNKFDPSGSRAAVVLASIQFTIGCACIAFQSVPTHMELSYGRVNTVEFLGTGIWCGILFLVTGAIGLGAGKRNSARLIIAFMVMNILSSLAVWTLLSFASLNMALVRQCQQTGSYTSSVFSGKMYCPGSFYSFWIKMDACLVALAVVELIIAVTSAAYCCKAVCLCCRSNTGMILQQPQSGVYVATTAQLPSQQQQHPQAMGAKPYPVQGPFMQYSADGAAGMVSCGQASYAQPGQPPFQQEQQVPLLPAYPQASYPQASYPQAAYPQAAYPQAAYPQAAYPQAAYPQAAYPQAAYPQAAYPQAAYSPCATSSAIPGDAGQSGAAYPGQTYYPPAVGDSKPVASAPELPPSYDAAQKL